MTEILKVCLFVNVWRSGSDIEPFLQGGQQVCQNVIPKLKSQAIGSSVFE